MLQVDELQGDDPAEAIIKRVRDYFLTMGKPRNFNPYDENSVLINEEKDFEDICIVMEDNGVSDVKGSTVFEFYSKVHYLERKAKKFKDGTGK